MSKELLKFITLPLSCTVVYFLLLILFITGVLDIGGMYRAARTTIKGVEQVEFQQVIDSVKNHSVEYEKKNIELNAEISNRLGTSSIMLTTPRDKIWWYVKTNEKSKGHDTIYGYNKGETYLLRLYIREIEYRNYENENKGRYYIWSEIIK